MKLPYSILNKRFKDNITVSQLSNALFQLGHEHEIIDDIFEMEFTPNRGDCLSVNGLTRDLSVFFNLRPDPKIYKHRLDEFNLEFENHIKKKCPKISFLEIEIEDDILDYKDELKDYFDKLNLKKNNFFTDISNYVLFETGQPTHCYDSSKINGKILLKNINENTIFHTLLDKKIHLTSENAVFMIEDKVINLAGIVGGQNTSCEKNTNKVIVECAFFEPDLIIGKSVKYDINSDAAYRFERRVDPNDQEVVLRRFIEIVSQHSTIKSVSYFVDDSFENSVKNISFDPYRINKVIGSRLSDNKLKDYLTKLGFKISKDNIEVPSFRNDVTNHNDIAEEISRLIGYDNIEREKFKILTNSNKTLEDHKEENVKNYLINKGFYEVINFPFTNKTSSIKIDNPLDSNKKNLRTDLKGSLIENLLFNERRQQDVVKLFEISDIYEYKNKIKNKKVLGVIASGRIDKNYMSFQKKVNLEYFENITKELTLKNIVKAEEIPRSSLDTKNKDKIAYFEIELDQIDNTNLLMKPKSSSNQLNYKYCPISDYPSSTRDLSFSIKDTTKIDELKKLVLTSNNTILKDVYIFDYYIDKKNKLVKMGFRFIFQSNLKTITDEEVDIEMKSIINSAISINSVTIPGLK